MPGTEQIPSGRPPVVRSGGPQVDLLPGRLANIVDEDRSRSRLNGESKGVAQSVRPHLAPGAGAADEGVVEWNRPVRIQPQELARQATEILGVCVGNAAVADSDVQLAVSP